MAGMRTIQAEQAALDLQAEQVPTTVAEEVARAAHRDTPARRGSAHLSRIVASATLVGVSTAWYDEKSGC